MKKYESLQIVRAVAAWLVVYHLYMQMFYNFKSDNTLSKFISEKGGFGVDLFFVLSGFVMFISTNNKEVSAIPFYIKRVFRIIPAYWAYTFSLLLLIAIFPLEFSFTDYTVKSLSQSLFLIPNQNPTGLGLYPVLTIGWTLIFEMCFYTILALCILIAKSRSTIICFILVLTLPLFYPNGYLFSSVLGSFIIWQFLFGFLIGWLTHSRIFKPAINLLPLHMLASLLLTAAIILLSGIFGFGLVQKSITAALIVLLFVLINDHISYNIKIINFLIKCGDRSYSIYLSHVLILGVFLHYMGNVFKWYQEALNIFLISVVIYFVSSLSYKFVENGTYILAMRGKLLNCFRDRQTN